MKHQMNSTIGDKEKPPRQWPGGEMDANQCPSALQRIAARPILDLGRRDGQTHLLAEDAGDESTDRMRLPTGGFHQIGSGGAAGALQQAEKLGGFTALACRGSLLGRLGRRCAPVGLPRPGGLHGQLALGRRDVARVCGNLGLIGGSRLPGWGTGLDDGGFFLNFVHIAFSLGGDYRDDHIHRLGSTKLQAESCAQPNDLGINGAC